jgi:hypothetical protein
MTSTYFFPLKFYLKGLQLCPTFLFSLKGNYKASPIMCFLDSPQPDHVVSVQFGFYLGKWLCERTFGYLQ